MKLLVCGTRGADNIANYIAFCEHIYDLQGIGFSIEEIVHGDCKNSPDMLAERYASEDGNSRVVVTAFPAQWNKWGKDAGFFRNVQMAEAKPDYCIAVWNGKSNGTRHMIETCVKRGIPVHIIPAKMD